MVFTLLNTQDEVNFLIVWIWNDLFRICEPLTKKRKQKECSSSFKTKQIVIKGTKDFSKTFGERKDFLLIN
jgi:hypothetical protein